MNKKLDDLIRIEDAIKVLCRKICHPGVFCPDGYCVEMWDEFNDIERVDAVPVVRCKDCRYWSGRKYNVHINGFLPWCGFSALQREADDFCSYGRRRGGDREKAD